MAKKYNKYGANHKNNFQQKKEKWADKVRQNVLRKNQLLGSEMNLPTNNEMIEGGWSFLHLTINNASVGKWFETDRFKNKLDELKLVPKYMIDGILGGMMMNNKQHDLLTDDTFLLLSFATHDVDVEQKLYELYINTKTGEHRISGMNLTEEAMNAVDELYKQYGAVAL